MKAPQYVLDLSLISCESLRELERFEPSIELFVSRAFGVEVLEQLRPAPSLAAESPGLP